MTQCVNFKKYDYFKNTVYHISLYFSLLILCCDHYVTVNTNPLHVAKNIFTSGGTILRDDKDFNKCLRLHSRQSLSVDELFCLIQLKS